MDYILFFYTCVPEPNREGSFGTNAYRLTLRSKRLLTFPMNLNLKKRMYFSALTDRHALWWVKLARWLLSPLSLPVRNAWNSLKLVALERSARSWVHLYKVMVLYSCVNYYEFNGKSLGANVLIRSWDSTPAYQGLNILATTNLILQKTARLVKCRGFCENVALCRHQK